MKISKILTVILLCAMIISVFSACSDKNDAPDGFQLVASEGDKFRLYVPTQGWTSNTQSGTTGAIFSVDPYIAINVFVADDAGEMDEVSYWSHSEALLKIELGEENYNFVSGDKITLSGQPARKYVYTAKMSIHGEEVTEYKIMTVLCRYKGEMYVFTYSAPSENHYDLYAEEVEGDGGILDLFKFDVPYSDEGKVYPDDVDVPDGMKIISRDEHPYRFFVPTSWKTNEKTDFSAAYVSQEDSSNVSLQFLMVSEKEMGKSIDDYFAECEERYKKVFSSYERLDSAAITMAGREAKKYTYKIVSGGIEYKQMQAIVEKGGVYYVLTYTSLPENFDSHLGDVDKMIEAFEIR